MNFNQTLTHLAIGFFLCYAWIFPKKVKQYLAFQKMASLDGFIYTLVAWTTLLSTALLALIVVTHLLLQAVILWRSL